MKIFVATDHAGFELKEAIVPFLEDIGFEVIDKGVYVKDPEDDYPDFVSLAAREVSSDPEKTRAIVFGYSGQAEAMASNKFPNVRAAVYYGEIPPLAENSKKGDTTDLITATREDNDSNVLSIGAGFVKGSEAKEVIKKWLESPFKGEERHIRRIVKLNNLPN